MSNNECVLLAEPIESIHARVTTWLVVDVTRITCNSEQASRHLALTTDPDLL